jgi:hypothetical protein
MSKEAYNMSKEAYISRPTMQLTPEKSSINRAYQISKTAYYMSKEA